MIEFYSNSLLSSSSSSASARAHSLARSLGPYSQRGHLHIEAAVGVGACSNRAGGWALRSAPLHSTLFDPNSFLSTAFPIQLFRQTNCGSRLGESDPELPLSTRLLLLLLLLTCNFSLAWPAISDAAELARKHLNVKWEEAAERTNELRGPFCLFLGGGGGDDDVFS